MYRIIRGIEVEDQFLRRTLKRGSELLHQHLMHLPRRFPIRPVLPSAQGRTTRQHPVTLHRRLYRQIETQPLMVIQIFIPQGQSIQALLQ